MNLEKNSLSARHNSHRYLIVSPLSSDYLKKDDKKVVVNQIKDYFEDPEKYLDINSKIIVGKKPQTQRFTDLKSSRNFFSEQKSIAEKNYISQDTARSDSNPMSNLRSSKMSSTFNSKRLKPIEKVIEDKNDKEIEDIFKKAKIRIDKSKDKINKEVFYNANIPNSTQSIFVQQENCLKINNKELQKSAAISKSISEKINKNEKDLLMNTTDTFRFKKQIFDLIDSKKPRYEKFGENSWLLDLRREKNPTTMRINFINVGSDSQPIWKPLMEYPSKMIRISHKPNEDMQKQLHYLFKGEYFNSVLERNNIDLSKFTDLTKLEVSGKSLIKNEYDQIQMIKGKKKLFAGNLTFGAGNREELFRQNYNVKYVNSKKSTERVQLI